MVDFSATANRIIGMIVSPMATLAHNSQPVPAWRTVVKEHVLPIIIATAVIKSLMMLALLPVYQLAFEALAIEVPVATDLLRDGLLWVVVQFADIAIWALVIGFISAAFGGRNDFNAAYVLVALALTPYLVSSALLPVPLIGPLLWIGCFIYAMVILYKGAPLLIGVPAESRGRHFVLSLVSMMLIDGVLTLIFSPMLKIPLGSMS